MSSCALCCFLCHEMVHFTDKNPTDFSNHMASKHKAFFDMELSLAVSLMDEKEKQIVKQIVWSNYVEEALDISSGVLCCFLCHEIVHFPDKNTTDFSNHMATKHKAILNMELSLAASLMNEQEKQTVLQIIWKNYVEDKKAEIKKYKAEKQIKQTKYTTVNEETRVDDSKMIAEDEDQIFNAIKEGASYKSVYADTSVKQTSTGKQDGSIIISFKDNLEDISKAITMDLVEVPKESKESTLNMSAKDSLDKERENKFNCEQCYLKLSTSGSLRKHILAVHEGVKFVCEECEKWFSTKTNLGRHNRVFHPISKLTTFNCEQCFKSFNQKSNLKMHMGVHTKVKAFICPVCEIAFTTTYHQRRHYSKQHSSRSAKYVYQSTLLENLEDTLHSSRESFC